MDDLIHEFVRQVPSLGVLAFVVWVFIRYQETRDEAIRQMHEEHLDARAESRLALRENTAAIKEQREKLSQQLEQVCQCLKQTKGS